MKVLFDTNILFSALHSPNSLPHRAFLKAGEEPYQALICEESLMELRRNFLRKYPAKAPLLDHFVMFLMTAAEIVPVPDEAYPEEDLFDDPTIACCCGQPFMRVRSILFREIRISLTVQCKIL